MPQTLRRLSLLAVILSAWALVGSDRTPFPFAFNQAMAGPSFSHWGDSGRNPDHTSDLSSLRILRKVIIYVKENYVDPKRVHPREMMLAALEYVEKTVSVVIVNGNAE